MKENAAEAAARLSCCHEKLLPQVTLSMNCCSPLAGQVQVDQLVLVVQHLGNVWPLPHKPSAANYKGQSIGRAASKVAAAVPGNGWNLSVESLTGQSLIGAPTKAEREVVQGT